MKTTAIPIVKAVVAMKMSLAKLAMRQNMLKAAMRSKAKWNCQLKSKIYREGEGTSELQLMGLKFSGRSTKTSIRSNLHGFQNSLNDQESLLMQPNFHQSTSFICFSPMKHSLLFQTKQTGMPVNIWIHPFTWNHPLAFMPGMIHLQMK